MNFWNKKEINRQFNAAWKKLDALEKGVDKALLLATHADKGSIEAHARLKSLLSSIKRLDGFDKILLQNQHVFFQEIQRRLNNNLKWIVGTVVSFMALFLAILKYLN